MNNWDDTRALLERYYEGETTLTEEKELKEVLTKAGSDLPTDLQAEAKILGWYCQERTVTSSRSIGDFIEALPLAEPDNVSKPKAKSVQFTLWPAIAKIAAAVALLLVGYGIGQVNQPDTTSIAGTDSTDNTSMLALQEDMRAVKQMLASGTTTGQRLQVVNNAAQVPANQVSNELLLALIQTLHFDDNVNVRLAAAEALLQYSDNPIVRQALARSLSLQTDPNVQMLLISGLTSLQEKTAVPVMEEMLQSDSLQPIVKQQLEESIAILL